MSKYTTEVRFICEQYAGLEESGDYDTVDTTISNARAKIFDFAYPIYDENYRSVLECKILKHFYTREICAETVSLWKLWLNSRMNEIMPYYNQLYESALLEFNPMQDTNVTVDKNRGSNGSNTNTKTGTGTNESTGRNISSNSGESWDYYSDTPQGGINGLSSNTYLTNATHDTATNNNTSSNIVTTSNANNETNNETYTNTEAYLESIVGKRSGTSFSKLLDEYRDTFINIDLRIINELEDLFFGLW